MKQVYSRIISFAILSVLLPFVYGCGGGGGGALGFLGGGGGGFFGSSFFGGGGSAAAAGGSFVGSAGPAFSVITNPEPATMLLLGGGLAAMAAFKKRIHKK